MSRAPSDTLRRRHHLVRAAAAQHDVDALVVTTRSNVAYLTNFTGSSGIVVLTASRLFFITDFRYVTAVESQQRAAHACPDLELTVVDGSYDATLATLIASLDLLRIGFEASNLTVSRHAWLAATLTKDGSASPALVATDQMVERIRVRKDVYEIETLRTAATLLSQVARGVFEEIGRGRTEREVALAIDTRIRRAGFERPAFDTIVASGPNSALPHATPGERTLSESDLVVLDFGGVYDSYCVDLTRTVSVGRAGDRQREVYGAVLEAHDRAIRTVGPGQSRFAIDAAARDWLTTCGLGEAFGHGTGHGLGIDIHEDPRITRPPAQLMPESESEGESGEHGQANDKVVTPGMVFTIEPGAYLAGWGGVRIEDDVLVTEHGVDVLTNVTTDLLEL
jgi:Xaa-Pro aminopeptidase